MYFPPFKALKPSSPNTFLKAHYDGLLLVSPSVMVIFKMQGLLPCSGTVAQTIKVLKVDQVCCNLFEFHNSYRFISWTPEGNIFNIQTTEMDIQVNQIFNNYSKKKYISGVFMLGNKIWPLCWRFERKKFLLLVSLHFNIGKREENCITF